MGLAARAARWQTSSTTCSMVPPLSLTHQMALHRMDRHSSALISASANGHLEVARLLCEAGADKDKAQQDGWAPLILASENGHLEVARLLCEAGADRDKARQDGATALILASSNGHLEVARVLCEAGADKDKARQKG